MTPPFVISREFNAPRARVWAAWTEGAHLGKWFGPTGFVMTQGWGGTMDQLTAYLAQTET